MQAWNSKLRQTDSVGGDVLVYIVRMNVINAEFHPSVEAGLWWIYQQVLAAAGLPY